MFKFKSFKNNSNSNNKPVEEENNNNVLLSVPGQDEAASTTTTTTNLSSRNEKNPPSKNEITVIPDTYKPISDRNLSAHQRYLRELESCAEDEKPNSKNKNPDSSSSNTNTNTIIDFDNFGKMLLEQTSGVKIGQALKEGGRTQQYAPKSVGGFATSENAIHNSADLKPGDPVIVLSQAEQEKRMKQAIQNQLPQEPNKQKQKQENGNPADSASSSSIAIPKRMEFVAEDDDEDDEDLKKNEVPVDIRQSQIGKTGGTIIRGDAKNVQVELCGSKKIETFSKIQLRPATEGEAREIEKIRQYTISLLSSSTSTSNAKSFGLFGNMKSGPFTPFNSAKSSSNSSSSSSSWTLFPLLLVTTINKNKNNNNSNDNDNDDDDDENGESSNIFTVTKALDDGKRAILNNGQTVSILDLEPVYPEVSKRKAIVIRQCENMNNNNSEWTPAIGTFVSVEKIITSSSMIEIKGVEGEDIGKVAIVKKNCLCSTNRR